MVVDHSRELLRSQLIKDISQLVCKPCTDPRTKGLSLRFDDPVGCPCRCATVQPLVQRLENLEREMGLRQ